MYLWTGDNRQERVRQSIYDVLARTRVELVRPEPTRPTWGRLVGILGALAVAFLMGGGLLWWANVISTWIAGRP